MDLETVDRRKAKAPPHRKSSGIYLRMAKLIEPCVQADALHQVERHDLFYNALKASRTLRALRNLLEELARLCLAIPLIFA